MSVVGQILTAIQVVFAAGVLCFTASCANLNSYAGISLLPGDADLEIQSLASRAKAGSKQAQLELGIRYEEGVGVPVDLRWARDLYRQAAEDTPLQYTAYLPTENGVRPETTYAGIRKGLREAADRLACLEQIVQVGERPFGASTSTRSANECNKKMTHHKEFPTTSKASRAASTPGPRTVSALLAKVVPPNDYIHEPDVPGETASDYFALSYNYDAGPPVQQFEPPELDNKADGENARRMSDAIPVDLEKSHIVLFDESVAKDDLSDLYGWYNDFWLISDRLRNLIEELDPGSIDCIEVVPHNLTPDEPYWVCLAKRNLEAVDATRTDVRVVHKTLDVEGQEPIVLRPIYINRGAVFDPEVTMGVHHFWDIDLCEWFWSRELIARAHHAGIRGLAFVHAGKPIGGQVAFSELDEIYAEFS